MIGLWSGVFALLSVLALGVVVWLWIRSNKDRAAVAAVDEAAHPVISRVASKFPSPSEDEAIALVKRAMSIRDEESVALYFRTGSASAAEVVGFLRTMHETDGEIADYQWLSSMDANGLLIDGVMVATSADGLGRNRLALLTPDESGRWKIDFEAFARTVKPAWSALLDKGAGQGVVRVIVAADTYFNGPFLDEDVWNCYGMASPDMDIVLSGYCRKDSPQARALERILAAGDQEEVRSLKRVILEIRRVEGGGPRQFEISKVLAEDWVLADKPYDEAFR